jgi:hypothetical protein
LEREEQQKLLQRQYSVLQALASSRVWYQRFRNEQRWRGK